MNNASYDDFWVRVPFPIDTIDVISDHKPTFIFNMGCCVDVTNNIITAKTYITDRYYVMPVGGYIDMDPKDILTDMRGVLSCNYSRYEKTKHSERMWIKKVKIEVHEASQILSYNINTSKMRGCVEIDIRPGALTKSARKN